MCLHWMCFLWSIFIRNTQSNLIERPGFVSTVPQEWSNGPYINSQFHFQSIFPCIYVHTLLFFFLPFPPDFDECASNPCLHSGICHNYENRYTCTCNSGYTGRICELGKYMFILNLHVSQFVFCIDIIVF